MADSGTCSVTRDGAVLTITINRPEVLNALDPPTHAALAAGLPDEGVIRPGARAAFTVFANDPLSMSAAELAAAEIVATYVDGARVTVSAHAEYESPSAG